VTVEHILGVPVEIWRFNEAIDWLVEHAGDRSAARIPSRVHFATVHSVVEAQTSDVLRQVFESASKVSPDGVPLVWLARLRGHRTAERVCGPDVMLALADRGRSAGLRHFFLGGRPGVADELAARLSTAYPGLEVAGTFTPTFGPAPEGEDAEVRAAIAAGAPDVVWIGLGSPKQEHWAAAHADLGVGLLLPVGAAFDFHSGRLRRAPRWIGRMGLEWLFRLAMEPRRLLRRYVGTNARFLLLVLREGIRSNRSGTGRRS
jgi:N-acetylglucosaminyldiphosphoundecaprenol N-acetyl-beta-D-mannosaminyltransferase